MSNDIRIIVDGLHGSDVAQRGGIRRVPSGTANLNRALVRAGEVSRDGQHGTRATRAIPGSPAGTLAVELSESQEYAGGLHVAVIDFASMQRPPSTVEVPAQCNILLSAVGGSGEPGRAGGNGDDAMDGIPGVAATRESDATSGTNGGRGGDAGEGTNGADGGNGGTVQIIVNEHNIHLLLAARMDVRGGQGGAPGRHGEPGRGGKGGNGGAGHDWVEEVGYRYDCTPNCIGYNVAANSGSTTSLVRSGTSRLASEMTQLVAHTRTQAVQGGNLQAMIAQVAARYGALRNPIINNGFCRCVPGGSGHCIGCSSTPIRKHFSREKAANGRDGQTGNLVTVPLVPGLPGENGTAEIIVVSRDNTESRYRECFNLELLDFEVEDENTDGIFEPGEHFFIRRIRIRNSGGMPSPICGIPMTIISSEWFRRVQGTQGSTFMPGSIPPGVTVTLEGTIKVFIQLCDDPPPLGTNFLTREDIRVMAVMPWLNRTLPHFEFSKNIEIQYPIELRKVEFLPNLARASQSSMTWEIYNKSVKELGRSSRSGRPIEVDVSMPADCGSLLSPEQEWTESVVNEVEFLPLSSSMSMKQIIQISPDAQNYRQLVLNLVLYLAVPNHNATPEDDSPIPVSIVQKCEIRIQISSSYHYNPRADVLLVTNPKTPLFQYQAIQRFLIDSLDLEMDEWNVGLYGGLSYVSEENTNVRDSVLSTYTGKVIVFLGNQFDFFKSGTRTIPQFCDSNTLAEVCARGTSCLFLGSLRDPSYHKLLRDILLPIPANASTAEAIPAASATISNLGSLVKSISQQILFGSSSLSLYKIPIKGRWYRREKENHKSEAKKVLRYLRKNLPQERFLVTAGIRQGNSDPNEKQDEAGNPLASLIVLHGNAQRVLLRATESHALERVVGIDTTSQRNRNATSTGPPTVQHRLNHYDAFMFVSSLPIVKRTEIAWTGLTSNGSPVSEYHFPTLQAVILSLQLDINREIHTVLYQSGMTNSLPLAEEKHDIRYFLHLHLPILAALLYHPAATATGGGPLPSRMASLLHYIEASCLPQSKREIATSAIAICRRRSKLQKIVKGAINGLLMSRNLGNIIATNADGITLAAQAQFHRDAKALHSYRDREKRNTHTVIVKRAAEMTRQSEFVFKAGCKTAREEWPKTAVYVESEEWDVRWRRIFEEGERVEREERGAREILGTMVLGSRDVGEENVGGASVANGRVTELAS